MDFSSQFTLAFHPLLLCMSELSECFATTVQSPSWRGTSAVQVWYSALLHLLRKNQAGRSMGQAGTWLLPISCSVCCTDSSGALQHTAHLVAHPAAGAQ